MKLNLVFYYNWETRQLKNIRYLSANILLLLTTIVVTIILPWQLMPLTPTSLVTVVKEDNLLFIGEAISFAEMNGGGNFKCRYGKCQNEDNRFLNLLQNENGDGVLKNDTIFALTDISKYPEISIYHPESPNLQKVIKDAGCGSCIEDTHLCSKLIHDITKCTCKSNDYLYVGRGLGTSKAELYDLSDPAPFQSTVSIGVPSDPPIGPLYGYAAIQTERGIMHCGGKTESFSKYSVFENQCYLLSEFGVWKTQAAMLQERFMPSMVKNKSELWVAGGQDSKGI